MNYSYMLDDMIKKSGLSLRQITKRCADMNYEVTPSYISQLKNGKLPPPSEEISKTLAIVCGDNNPMKLVFQGYLEKAPEIIRNYILMSSSVNKTLIHSLSEDAQMDISKELGSYIDDLDVVSSLDMSTRYIQSMNECNLNDFFKELNTMSGAVYQREDDQTESSYFFLRDSSMTPLIAVNAHIKIVKTKKTLLKNRDVVAFYPKNSRTPFVRRYYEKNGSIILVPENKDHEIFLFGDRKEFNYIGKVISYKMNF
ncbi:MAG: S24 family peptidase [Clostridia bacterium]|nr:S24 family peptidase [Clostridia bacterium]